MTLDSWEAKRIMHGYVWNPDKDDLDPVEHRWAMLQLVIELPCPDQTMETRLAMSGIINKGIEC